MIRMIKTIRVRFLWAFVLCFSSALATGIEIGALLIGALISTGISVGLQVVSSLLTPKPAALERGKREPLQQDSQYGNQIPRIYGKVRLAGEVIWTSGIREVVTTTPGRGKGKRRTPDTQQYSYYASIAVRFCVNTNPANPILPVRIWFDTKLIGQISDLETLRSEVTINALNIGSVLKNRYATVTQPALTLEQLKWYGGTAQQRPDPTIEADKGVGNVSGHRRHAYVVLRDIQLDEYGARIPNITIEMDEGTTSVAEIVRRELELSGLQADEIDVTALADDVCDGLVVPGRQSARTTIDLLSQAYFFDMVEVDGQIKAVKRGGLPVVTIPYRDIGVVEGNEDAQAQPRLSAVEAQRLELPRGVTVTYTDASLNYETGTAIYNRQTYQDNVENAPIDLSPLVLSPAKANQVARTLSVIAWTEKRQIGPFTIPPSYLKYIPTDVVTIEDADGATQDVRITRQELAAGGKIAVTAVKQLASAYRQRQVASGGQQTSTQTVEEIAKLTKWFWGGYALNDVDALTAGFYVAACRATDSPANSKWRGFVLFRNEAGTDEDEPRYEPLLSGYTEATLGKAITRLENGSDTDVTNTVDVILERGTLESITQSVFDSSATVNVAILGNEILQFRDATQPDAEGNPNLWRLSVLKRQLRNTVDGAATHKDDDVFVLWKEAIRRVVINTNELGVERHYKAATFGEDIEDVEYYSFTAL